MDHSQMPLPPRYIFEHWALWRSYSLFSFFLLQLSYVLWGKFCITFYFSSNPYALRKIYVSLNFWQCVSQSHFWLFISFVPWVFIYFCSFINSLVGVKKLTWEMLHWVHFNLAIILMERNNLIYQNRKTKHFISHLKYLEQHSLPS